MKQVGARSTRVYSLVCIPVDPIIVMESFYHMIDLGLANFAEEFQIPFRRPIKMTGGFCRGIVNNGSFLHANLEEACGSIGVSTGGFDACEDPNT